MCLCFRELIARTDSATTLKTRLTQSHVRNVTIWKNASTKWYVFLNLEGSLLGHIASNQNLKSFVENPSSFFGIQYQIIYCFSKNGKHSIIWTNALRKVLCSVHTKCSMFTCSFVQDCDFKIAPTRVLLLHSLAVLLPRG